MKKIFVLLTAYLYSFNAFSYDQWDRNFMRFSCKINSERYANYSNVYSAETKKILDTTISNSEQRKIKLGALRIVAENIEDEAFKIDRKYFHELLSMLDLNYKYGIAMEIMEGDAYWMRKNSIVWSLENPGKSLDFFTRIIYEECIKRLQG